MRTICNHDDIRDCETCLKAFREISAGPALAVQGDVVEIERSLPEETEIIFVDFVRTRAVTNRVKLRRE